MSVNLTTLQKEVLDLLAQGLTAEQTGEKLGRSPNTIKAHVRFLKHKFGIPYSNTTQLVTLYRSHYPGPDRIWMMIADIAAAGELRDVATVLLAHITSNGVSVEEMADRMNRSINFVKKLVDCGQKVLGTRNCSVGQPD